MKVVISGSISLQKNLKEWIKYWSDKKGDSVLDHPKAIPKNDFDRLYPSVHKNFYKNITKADVLFIANDTKNGFDGYIGPSTFAELGFGIALKLIHGKKIRIILANMPSKDVSCYNEIVLWKKMGWIDDVLN